MISGLPVESSFECAPLNYPSTVKAYARDRHGAAAAAKAPGTRAALSDLSVALPSAEPVAYAAAAAQIVTWLKRRKEGCPAPDATSV